MTPDFAIDHPVMRQQWRTLTYVHWPVPITEVASRLPQGLTVDTFDGHAWVESAGVPINDRPDVGADFTPFDAPLPPGRFSAP